MEKQIQAVQNALAVVLDIEATSLYADFGHILCAVVKPVDGEPIVLRLDEYQKVPTYDDSPLVKDLISLLSSAPLVVSWNGDRFDIPYIRTRKMIAEQQGMVMPVAHTKSLDMLRVRRKFRLHNNRLETWMDNITPTRKTDVLPLEWRQAQFFHRSSMDYVVDHCVKDVEGTEEVFRYIWRTVHNLKPVEVFL